MSVKRRRGRLRGHHLVTMGHYVALDTLYGSLKELSIEDLKLIVYVSSISFAWTSIGFLTEKTRAFINAALSRAKTGIVCSSNRDKIKSFFIIGAFVIIRFNLN